ncbi:MAG: protein kinase [Planctomycetota bacterium]|nr:protein kinase [Planctomycetota bacterium]
MTEEQGSSEFGDRYEVLGVLGRGGIGRVYLALDRQMRREVAIKSLIHPDQEVIRVRFLEEAQITSQLEHPNIVPVHEMARNDKGEPFLVMKRIRGQSLQKTLDLCEQQGRTRGGMLQQLLDVFAKVCDGISYAHSRGVVHRDLKPDNIMVGQFGEVLLLDWGLARIQGTVDVGTSTETVESDRQEMGLHATRDGAIQGTPAFMSPEQIRGDPVDARSDIYSLGAILYTILTLKKPYEGNTAREVLDRARTQLLIPPSQRNPVASIPRELEAIVLKSMFRDPEGRYQSVEALRRDLNAYREGRVIEAVRYTPLDVMRKWIQRNQVAVAGMVATILVALLGYGGTVWTRKRATEEVKNRERIRIEEQLDQISSRLAVFEEERKACSGRIHEGSYSEAIESIESLLQKHRGPVEEIVENDRLRKYRFSRWQDARRFADSLISLRADAIYQWVDRELEVTDRLSSESDPNLADRLEDSFERFLAYQKEGGKLKDLSVSIFALRRLRIAMERGEDDVARRWAARALVAQPRSLSTQSALWMLGKNAYEKGKHEEAVGQLHLAISLSDGRTRGELFLLLARSLASLGDQAVTPFAPEVSAREMALRCLLQVVGSDGRWNTDYSAPESVQRLAVDWFEILRRITMSEKFQGEFLGIHRSGREGFLLWKKKSSTIRLVHRDPPKRPGMEPSTLVVSKEFDLTPWVRSFGEDARLLRVSGVGPGGKASGVSFLLDVSIPSKKMFHLIGIKDLESMEAVFRLSDREPLFRWPRRAFGDLDGDGRVDFVFSTKNSFQMLFQDPGGRWSGPRRLPSARGGESGSWVRSLSVADLDGDGRTEVVVSRGEFNDYSVEVHQVNRNRDPVLKDVKVLGRTSVSLLPDRKGFLVVTANHKLKEDWKFFDEFQGARPQKGFGYFVWKYRKGRLIDHPGGHVRSSGGFAGYGWTSGPFALGDGEVMLASHESKTSCFLYNGKFLDSTAIRRRITIPRVELRYVQGVGLVAESRYYRTLDSADLDVLRERSIPLASMDQEDELLFIVRYLMGANLAREAVEVLRRPEQEGKVLGVQALRLLLQALRASGLPDALENRIESIQPDLRFSSTIHLCLERLGRHHRRYDFVAKTYRTWGASLALPGVTRRLFRAQADLWGRVSKELGTSVFDLRGTQVVAGDFRGEAEDLLVTNRPGLVWINRSGDQENLVFRSVPLETQVLEVSPQTSRVVKNPHFSMAGFGFRYERGSFRIVQDVKCSGIFWAGGQGFSVFPLQSEEGGKGRTLPPKSRLGWTVHCRGGNEVNRVVISPGEVQVDSYLNRSLRIEMEYLAPFRQYRFVIADRVTGDVLYHRVSGKEAPLQPGSYLLAFGLRKSGQWHPARIELERMVVLGQGKLVSERDMVGIPWLQGQFRGGGESIASFHVEGALGGSFQMAGRAVSPRSDR